MNTAPYATRYLGSLKLARKAFKRRITKGSCLLSGLLLCASVSTAQKSITATQLVNRWRRAIHHTARKGQAIHLITKSTQDGIPGQIETWITGDGRYKQVTKREFDEDEIVIRPTAAYRLDWNGFLRHLQDDELKRAVTRAYLDRALFMGPDVGARELTASPGTAPEEYSLVVLPDGGKKVTWYIDSKSWLPRRSVWEGVDSEITTTYSDWQGLGGIYTARSGKVTETDKPDYEWERLSAQYSSDIGDQLFAAPKAGPSDSTLAPNAPPIPFRMEADHIVFDVSVNGRPPIGFILDTGDDQEAINTAYMKEFGLEVYGRSKTTGGGNSTDYLFASGASFSWPGGQLRNQHVAAVDQTGLERALGVKIGGLLGYDFLSRFIVEIDYQKKLITLHDPQSWNYNGSGFQIPITFDEGVPFTHATITAKSKHDIPAYFVIDFGAMETMTLTSPFARSNDLYAVVPNNSNVNKPAGLEKQFFAQQNVRGKIDELRAGNLQIHSIPVNMSVNTTGAYASTSFSGTIGEGIFKRYHVFLDYAHHRVILEPTPAADTPFPERRTYGLSLLASGPDLRRYTVTAVRPGSPAEQDGFVKGDVVAELDGKREFTLQDMRDALLQEGAVHTLAIQRQDVARQIQVHVRLVNLEHQ